MTSGEEFDSILSDVVPRLRVIGPGIPEPDYE
jgi:hypothetical protein